MTIYAIAIFAPFVIRQLFDYSENIFPDLDTPLPDVLVDSLTFAILVLFFLAIVRIKNYLYHNWLGRQQYAIYYHAWNYVYKDKTVLRKCISSYY
jgi:flagellar biosynthesis protein FliQ